AAERAAKAKEIGLKVEKRPHMLCSERAGKADGQAFGLGGGYEPGEHLKAEVVKQRAGSLAHSIEHHSCGAELCRSLDRIETRQGIGENHQDQSGSGSLGRKEARGSFCFCAGE